MEFQRLTTGKIEKEYHITTSQQSTSVFISLLYNTIKTGIMFIKFNTVRKKKETEEIQSMSLVLHGPDIVTCNFLLSQFQYNIWAQSRKAHFHCVLS